MVTAAWAGVTMILFLGTIAVHHAGHTAAFTDLELPTAQTSVIPLRRSLLPEHTEALNFRAAAWYAASGVIANLTLGLGLLGSWFFVTGHMLPALITGGAAIGVWAARHWVALVIVPAAGVTVLATELWGFTTHAQAHTGTLLQLLVPRHPAAALLTAAVLSVSVALFTMLPINPLDGSHMMAATARVWRSDRARVIHARVSGLVVAAVIGVAILSDALRLITPS